MHAEQLKKKKLKLAVSTQDASNEHSEDSRNKKHL